MPAGWIKVYRQMLDNELYQEKPFDKLHAWLDILLMVNHERKQFYSKGELVTLEPGQTITSVPILAKRWGWSEGKVRRFLGSLNGSAMCSADGSARGTTLTVVNWGKFQDGRRADGSADGSAGGSANGSADGTLTRNKEVKKREGGPKAPTHLPPFSDRSSIVDQWVKNIKAKEGTN